ncbi:MAG: bifunctional phosphoribosylaminoimidazolecarboxamide formyltransferase/IMP cyclohydrolase [Elusimicrobiota bacterium]
MNKEFQKTALLSVADTTGIVEFSQGLHEAGFAIISSGQTAATLKKAKIPFKPVAELTRYPDICGGRLRLTHPRLLGGIIADRGAGEQMRDLDREGIPPIDLVAVNLYPLSEVFKGGGAPTGELMDFLDVSSSALLRAAARNFNHVVTVCDPADYPAVLDSVRGKGLTVERSQSLAAKAFYYISYYDSTVAQYLSDAMEKLPDEMIISLKKTADLRYGANPHQGAALYGRSGSRPWGLIAAELLFGKPLSYGHYIGMDRAAELVAEFQEPACAITKLANPAGAASCENLGEAARQAYLSDPEGCTGGIAAFNREVDKDAAAVLAPEYLECIAAPDFSTEAMDMLRTKKDVRLVRLPSLLLSANETDIKTISGGVILQDRDHSTAPETHKVVSRRKPTPLEIPAMQLASKVAKHALSHSAVLAHASATLGIAAGQTARIDAVRLAIVKSQERHPVVPPTQPMALASDGALSPRHLQEAAANGISAVIQPGGTSEDRDSIQVADELDLAMIFTGTRHFRH